MRRSTAAPSRAASRSISAEVLGVHGDLLARGVRAARASGRGRAAPDGARASARTPGTRARRSSTDPCGRRAGRGTRAARRRARARPRARPRSRRARRTRADRPRPGGTRTRLRVDLDVVRGARARKCSRQRAVWNVTTSFASSPRGARARTRSGSACQSSGSGHGMCTKCESVASGRSLAHEPRREIQVVVVEEHGRVGPAVELLADRVRERAIHRRVGVPRGNVDRIGQLGQRVLDEPERRVRDDVVEAVVRLRIVRDQAHAAAVRRRTAPLPRPRGPPRSARSRST